LAVGAAVSIAFGVAFAAGAAATGSLGVAVGASDLETTGASLIGARLGSAVGRGEELLAGTGFVAGLGVAGIDAGGSTEFSSIGAGAEGVGAKGTGSDIPLSCAASGVEVATIRAATAAMVGRMGWVCFVIVLSGTALPFQKFTGMCQSGMIGCRSSTNGEYSV
jgi:hypothetical protein